MWKPEHRRAAERHGRIAICFVEWSGATSQKLVIDWTIVSDLNSARKIGDQMLELPRSTQRSATLPRSRRSSRTRRLSAGCL